MAEAPSERTAQWLIGGAPADEAADARRARAADRRGEDAPAQSDEPAAKPKRPRAPRAKAPAATGDEAADEAEADPGEEACEPAPEFAPEPNGRRDEPRAPPQAIR